MYRNVVVQTVQTVLFVADLDFQTFSNKKKKTQVSSKLTKKYFYFIFFLFARGHTVIPATC